MANIDPNIALQTTTIPGTTAMTTLAQVGEIRARQQQAAASQAETDQRTQQTQIAGAAYQRMLAGRQALGAAVKQFTDPQTGHSDNQQIANTLSQAGFADEAESWLKTASANEEALGKIRDSHVAHANAQADLIGSLAEKIDPNSPTALTDFQSSIAQAAKWGVGGLDAEKANDILSTVDQAHNAGMGPQAIAAIRDQYMHLSPSKQASDRRVTEKMSEPMVYHEGDGVLIPGQLASSAQPAAPASAVPPPVGVSSTEVPAVPVATPGVLVAPKPKLTKDDQWVDASGQPTYVDDHGNRFHAGGKPFGANEALTRYVDPGLQASRDDAMATRALARAVTEAGLHPNAGDPWTLTADPPDTDPTKSNQPNPDTGLSQNALFTLARRAIEEGSVPSIGMGGKPLLVAQRNAVQNKTGAILAAAGVDPGQAKAAFKASGSALTGMTQKYAQTAAAAQTAAGNLQLAQDEQAKVSSLLRSSSPITNDFTQWLNTRVVTGDPQLAALKVYIYGAARDYAKTVTGSAASVSELTKAGQDKADALLNAAQSPTAFTAAVQAMQREMAQVTGGQLAQIDRLDSTIGKIARVTSGVPVDTPAVAATAKLTNTPKTVTEADLQAAMKLHGWTHDQAIAEAKARGFSVIGG